MSTAIARSWVIGVGFVAHDGIVDNVEKINAGSASGSASDEEWAPRVASRVRGFVPVRVPEHVPKHRADVCLSGG